MEKINQMIMTDFSLLDTAILLERSKQEDNYSYYHEQILGLYEGIRQSLYAITNYQHSNDEDFLIYCSTFYLTDDKQREYLLLRKKPIYIKAMGEGALFYKKRIEELLHFPIHNLGHVFPMDRQAFKCSSELEEDGWSLKKLLDDFYETGKISNSQYRSFHEKLFYIYLYYDSIQKGEQLPYQKYSNQFYAKIDRLAQKRRIPFSIQYQQTMDNMRFQFEDLQKMEEDYYLDHKKTSSK